MLQLSIKKKKGEVRMNKVPSNDFIEKGYLWQVPVEELSKALELSDGETRRMVGKLMVASFPGWIVGKHHATFHDDVLAPDCVGVVITESVKERLEKNKAPGTFKVVGKRYEVFMMPSKDGSFS